MMKMRVQIMVFLATVSGNVLSHACVDMATAESVLQANADAFADQYRTRFDYDLSNINGDLVRSQRLIWVPKFSLYRGANLQHYKGHWESCTDAVAVSCAGELIVDTMCYDDY